MSELGDLLEAMWDGPRYRSLHARGRSWARPGAYMELIDRHRADGFGGVLVFGSTAPAAESRPVEFEIWCQGSDTVRLDEGDGVSTLTPDSHLSYSPERNRAVRSPAEGMSLRGESVILAPGDLIRQLVNVRLVGSEPGPGGRPAWAFTATTEDPLLRGALSKQLPGIDYRMVVDQRAGVIVGATALIDSEQSSWMAVDQMEVDQDIDDSVFAFEPPPDVRVMTQAEVWLEAARNGGFDISGIDPNDLDQVNEARQRWAEQLRRQQPPDPDS